MLSINLWRVDTIHLIKYLLIEILWRKDLSQIWLLEGSFIEWVTIVHGIVGIIWFPLFHSSKVIIKDFLCIHANESSVHIISDSATIITISDQTLNGWPWNWVLLVK